MQIVSITGFDISCKLSPLETICLKCQILFSGKNKKNISRHLLKMLRSVNILTRITYHQPYQAGINNTQNFHYSKCPKISYTNISDKMVYANSADPDQTAPEEVHIICHSTKYLVKQMHKKQISGPSCSKLTTSLVNDSLKFTLIRKYAEIFC